MKTLHDYGIISDGKFIRQILEDSLLKISEGKVYLDLDEEDLQKDNSKVDFENLSDESKKFLSANSENIQFNRKIFPIEGA